MPLHTCAARTVPGSVGGNWLKIKRQDLLVRLYFRQIGTQNKHMDDH
jgi:hypothetical protein